MHVNEMLEEKDRFELYRESTASLDKPRYPEIPLFFPVSVG